MADVSRRSFLLGAATIPVAAALAPAVIAAAPVPAVATLRAEFGYCLADRHLWSTGYVSRAEAVAAAVADGAGAAFQTAEVSTIGITYPDFAEAASDWLLNEGHLGNWLCDALTGHNQDADFEGEFADACNRASREPIGEAGRKALGAALRRCGAMELAEKVEAGDTPDDSPIWDVGDDLHDQLRADAALGAEIEAAVRAWVDANNLESELRGLDVAKVEEHPATVAAEMKEEG